MFIRAIRLYPSDLKIWGYLFLSLLPPLIFNRLNAGRQLVRKMGLNTIVDSSS
jgi:hypothetical protein